MGEGAGIWLNNLLMVVPPLSGKASLVMIRLLVLVKFMGRIMFVPHTNGKNKNFNLNPSLVLTFRLMLPSHIFLFLKKLFPGAKDLAQW